MLQTSEMHTAVFKCTVRYPFEDVLATWEGGTPDPNFIKEEVKVVTNGAEEHRTKTLYTKNPLPYIIRKTVSAALIPVMHLVFASFLSFDLHACVRAWTCIHALHSVFML